VKKIAVVVAVVLFAAVPATCFVWQSIWRGRTTYCSADIEVLAEGIHHDGFTLVFRPPCETLYYCPGVVFGKQGPSIQFERPAKRTSTTRHYEYVRSPIGRTAQVDIKAKSQKDGSLSVTFPFLDGKWEKGDLIVLSDSAVNRRHQYENLGVGQSKVIKANH
jgi:hypothetical protein